MKSRNLETKIAKNRNTSIDLLKALSMMMVVLLHITGYGISETMIAPNPIVLCCSGDTVSL